MPKKKKKTKRKTKAKKKNPAKKRPGSKPGVKRGTYKKPVVEVKYGKKEDVDLRELDKLLEYQFMLKDCADFFMVSEGTIETVVKQNYGMKFCDYKAKKAMKYKHLAVQKLIMQMECNNIAAIIFFLKAKGGWSETKQDAPMQANGFHFHK